MNENSENKDPVRYEYLNKEARKGCTKVKENWTVSAKKLNNS